MLFSSSSFIEHPSWGGSSIQETAATVNPGQLEIVDNICCCWFESVEEDRFVQLCAVLAKQGLVYHCLRRENGIVLYGFVVPPRNGVLNASSFPGVFPKWCSWEFPIGNEDAREFFERIQAAIVNGNEIGRAYWESWDYIGGDTLE